MKTNPLVSTLVLGGVGDPGAAAAVAPEAPIRAIADNSFLVEEAYNQEPGVVQHIVTAHRAVDRRAGADDRVWALAYTQEWPLVTQTHQIGFTLPYQFVESGGQTVGGWGDLLLNYRWQAWYDEAQLTALAPRLSLVWPTGDAHRGLGHDTVGFEVNLPFSTALDARWAVHVNAGLRHLPRAGPAPRADLTDVHLGASLIYAFGPHLHGLLEGVAQWEETRGPAGDRTRAFAAVVSPGLRRAFHLPGEAQLVLGLAAPIGLTGAAPDWGVFFYLSVEHGFRRCQASGLTAP